MHGRNGRLALVVLTAIGLMVIPSMASAWTERGGGSSVDGSLEAKGCEFCHGTSDTYFPYLRPNGIHGGYTSTSNQCASCHYVHDAVGVKLLPKATATDTCLECHDGTGGFGVYGTIKARTGAGPASGHSALTDRTNVVPGGASTGGSRVETEYRGEEGFLGCVDCHSPHGSQLVAAFNTERQRYDRDPFGFSKSTNLLKQKPNGSDTTTVYGSAWCSGCHRGRHSSGSAINHPVDSGTFSYDSVPLAPWPGVVDISCNGSNGNVFVGDPRLGYLALFNQDFGAFGASQPHLRPGARAWSGANYDLTASGVGTNAGGTRIAVTDTEANIVTVRDSDTIAGNVVLLRPTGRTGGNQYPSSTLGEFNAPTDAAIGPGDVTYVVDSMNDRVQRFDASGVAIDTFGSHGSGPGQFDRPLSIAIDAAGLVYVADAGNHRIQRFTAAGAYDTSLGTVGTAPGQFRLPSGVAVNAFNGDVYVVDAGNSRVQRLTSAGVFVSQWGTLGSGNTQFVFQPQETGSMAYALDSPNANPLLSSRQMYKGLVYAGRGYVMQDPRTPAQAGHGPICQQCHEDARDAGSLYDGLPLPAPAMTVLDGRQNDTGAVGERDRANPRFQNFPHETMNPAMLVETNDDLCTNCHSVSTLP